MQSTAQRIKELIEALSMTIYSFSNECGYVGASTIWNIIDKNKKPNKNTSDKICYRFPQVNREWLITGHGSMFIKTSAKEDEELTVTAKQVLDRLQPLIPDLHLIEKATKTMNDFIYNYNRYVFRAAASALCQGRLRGSGGYAGVVSVCCLC